MLGTAYLQNRIGTLLASDTAGLAGTTSLAPRVSLVVQPFTPSPNVAIATLTLATFTGSSAITCVAGTQFSYFDPATQNLGIQLKSPASGWNWQCTSTAPGSSQTVFGFVVADASNVNTFGCGLLPSPVVITNVGDLVNIPIVNWEFPINTLQ